MIVLERVTQVDAELVTAFARLIPQLSVSPPPGEPELREIVAAPGNTLLLARDAAGAIVGLSSLVIYRIPTGLHARIDDVVVDSAVRKQGIGEALTREAIRLATMAGVKAIHLTSHPSRDAANRMYARLGFVRRETHVYLYKISTK